MMQQKMISFESHLFASTCSFASIKEKVAAKA